MDRCETCKWWDTDVPDMVSQAPCKRFPPTGYYHLKDNTHTIEWPHTNSFNLCGEHQPQQEKTNETYIT